MECKDLKDPPQDGNRNHIGTYIKRRGVCEGQARLMRVLLNNWDMQMDAVTIDGKTEKQEPHTSAPSEYYPKIYPSSSLSREQIANVERHVKSLKKYR